MSMLSNFSLHWQNVTNANGITITIIGMILVFFSLTLITLIIGWTPYFLKIVNRFIPEVEEESTARKSVKTVSETEVVAAISAALCHSIQSTNKQA